MKNIILTLIVSFQVSSFAHVAAILDNGMDYTHKELKYKIKINEREVLNSRDDDHNGYRDDIRGWNFINMSNKVFDLHRDIEITDEIKLYYALKAKFSLETITDTELATYEELKKDKELKKKRKELTSWIHGTHVGAIAVSTKDLPRELTSRDLKALIITYLGKATEGPAKAPEFTPLKSGTELQKKKHIASHWKKYISWQVKKLGLAVEYAASKAVVINGSFGQSFKGAKKMVSAVYKEQYDKELSDEEAVIQARVFMTSLIEKSTILIKRYPKMLFVFSAGNKKSDTDEFLHFPSSIRLPNLLSVGASFDFQTMAYFSNFGKKTVDLFAPGVAIKSAIPKQEYLKINGTSQAAPFITNVALKAFTLATKIGVRLTAKTLKQIIMDTVQVRTELKDKSVSSGIVYPNRIYSAIRFLRDHKRLKAIALAIKKYPTIVINKSLKVEDGFLMELPEIN
ncbi:hypothetical protein A9Q84_02730 [Halobacteriovorax marinus]|uniref:Peptidase S8/S53 domain-containing protein n=1 Tax=Halobacteriovorax marinus TaxID=97084 RepID=A0A1Y5FIF2_9BACT|nr:hypothetical protein A9Q84_02730 [Halobacteriovorax marinus]